MQIGKIDQVIYNIIYIYIYTYMHTYIHTSGEPVDIHRQKYVAT